jgi:Uma2 family endonuclease
MEMIKMDIQHRLYTIEEFERFAEADRDRRLELIDGEIVEKMPTEEHGVVVLNIGTSLKIFIKREGISGRVGVEIRHRKPGDRRNSLIPDLSLRLNPTQPVVTQGSLLHMPDLAVEVQSPDDSIEKMREKALYYLRNGSRLVWLVYPQLQTVEVCTLLNGELFIETLGINDTLTGGALLPGYTMAVSEIFEMG